MIESLAIHTKKDGRLDIDLIMMLNHPRKSIGLSP